MTTDNYDDASLPLPLADELSRAYPHIPVPSEVDDAVLWAARQHFARHRRRRLLVRCGAAGAVAAALFIAISLSIHSPATAPHNSVALPGDLNGDGRVDMIDAYLLARRMQTHLPPPANADFSHDGVIHQKDVDQLAQAAVSLTPVTLQ